ncbi:hypothetical protein LguiA_035584 [Lonicera macranthoides]
MTLTANLNGVMASLPNITKLNCFENALKRSTAVISFHGKKTTKEIQENSVKATRRTALGLASIALVLAHSSTYNSLADDNGYWLTTPIPVPSAYNKIANDESGTRSFLKKGIYIANIGTKGRIRRLKKYAFDLLAMGDLIGQDMWHYIRMYLRLKSTFMYFDFDNVISASSVNDKQPLTDLANRLFDNVEKLEDAVKKHDLPVTQSLYQDTTTILQEVMERMA